MKSRKLIPVFATLLIGASGTGAQRAQSNRTNRLSPHALVADLYRQHDRKHSPFFQTRSRALLYKYFEKNLADMIWKDARGSKEEVGAIDGDPLYDAQDMEIKKFVIGKASYENGKARVNVSFENFGQKRAIVFLLVNGRTGWKISDIDYGEGRTLAGELRGDGGRDERKPPARKVSCLCDAHRIPVFKSA